MTYEIGKTKISTESDLNGDLRLFKNGKNIALFKMGTYKLNPYSNSKGKVFGLAVTVSTPFLGKYYFYVNEKSYGIRKTKTCIFNLLNVMKKDYKEFGAKIG